MNRRRRTYGGWEDMEVIKQISNENVINVNYRELTDAYKYVGIIIEELRLDQSISNGVIFQCLSAGHKYIISLTSAEINDEINYITIEVDSDGYISVGNLASIYTLTFLGSN